VVPKTVVITGASSGIGEALAVELAGSGYNLTLAARNCTHLENVLSRCRDLGAKAVAVPTDVTRPEDCRRLIESTLPHFPDSIYSSIMRASP